MNSNGGLILFFIEVKEGIHKQSHPNRKLKRGIGMDKINQLAKTVILIGASMATRSS